MKKDPDDTNSEDENAVSKNDGKVALNKLGGTSRILPAGIQAELIDDKLHKESKEREFIEQHVAQEYQHMFYLTSPKIEMKGEKPQSSPTDNIEIKDSLTWIV